jgi:hypothetical protein
MDQSGVTQNRTSRRSPVLLAACIDVDGAQVAVKLRNLSERGALIEGDRLPREGAETCFQRNELVRRSRVVWVQGRYAGVAFDCPLNPEELLRQVPQPRTKVHSEVRRPGFTCRPLTSYERRMLETWMASAQLNLIED